MDGATPHADGELRLGLAELDGLRFAVADVATPLEEARRRLDLSPVAAVALGRALAAAALLLRFTTKDLGRLTVEVAGDGPLGKVIAEIDGEGNLRGLVGTPQLARPAAREGLAIGWAVGEGVLRVIRERTGRPSYSSQVELVTGEIGGDLAHFLDQSEQIRSAALLGVLPRPYGIAAAGGLLVEALPGTEDSALDRLETNIAALEGVSRPLAEGGVTALVEAVMGGFRHQVIERRGLRYHCRCSAAGLSERLADLDTAELDAVTDARGECVAECAYCGNRYRLDRQQLAATN